MKWEEFFAELKKIMDKRGEQLKELEKIVNKRK